MNKKLKKDNLQIKGLPGETPLNFWSWAYSDLLSNTIRPVFEEYIVGSVLGLSDIPRIEWNAYDFEYKGKKIEVKSAGYLQSWSEEPS